MKKIALAAFGGAALIGVHFAADAAESRGKGAVLLPAAAYQALPSVPRYRAFLPPSVDLSRWFPAVGHQGGQPSCTAWSTAYYLRSYYENRLASETAQAPTPLSPAFVYNQLAHPPGQCSEGLAIPDALTLLKDKGAPPLASFPYSEKTCAAQPDSQTGQLAGRFRIESWKRLDTGKPDDVKGELAAGNPVVVAMMTPPNFDKFKGGTIYDDAKRSEEAHAMAVVGYDDAKRAFRLINSWGTDWGDDGYAWVSYRAFQTDVAEAYSTRIAQALPPLPLSEPPKPIPVVELTPKPELPKPAPVVIAPPTPEPPKPALVVVEPPKYEPPKPTPVVVEPLKTEPPKPAPVVVGPPRPAPLLPSREQLDRETARLACAKVRIIPAKGPARTLDGFVSTVDDLRKLSGLASGADLSGIAMRPWPQCEALMTFETALAQPRGLKVSISGSQPAVIVGGQPMVIELTTPSFPSFVYLTYLQASGDAVHLVQPQGLVPKALPPNTKLTLGTPPGPVFRIGPPFGAEMIVAIASASPLFQTPRPPTEIERDYLTAFRLSFLEKPARGTPARIVSAATTTLTTRAP
ncbi:MAG: DUF4384 domain-containing protein [Alphaproteobacteria bacterium]|nr:DUF4384 domain-containing protein [Alphaproteobacteria bacterium]